MKTVVLYDTQYGNTQKIAQAIASAIAEQLGADADVQLKRPAELVPSQLAGVSLLVVGSATQRFAVTPALMEWLKAVPKSGLQGIPVATFDTRLTEQQIKATPVLKWFVRKSSYAAWWLEKELRARGGAMILPPEGFYVQNMEGPLVPGEIERAALWGKQVCSAAGPRGN